MINTEFLCKVSKSKGNLPLPPFFLQGKIPNLNLNLSTLRIGCFLDILGNLLPCKTMKPRSKSLT